MLSYLKLRYWSIITYLFVQVCSVGFIYPAYLFPTPYLLLCKLQLREENPMFELNNAR